MPAANRGPWGSFATIAFTIVIALAFLLVQGAVAIPYLLLTAGETSPKAIEAAAGSLESDGRFVGISEVCSGTAALALTLLFAWARKGPAVRDYLGLRVLPRSVVLRWLLYAALTVLLLEGMAHLTNHPSVPEWMFRIYRSPGSVSLLLFAVIAVAMLQLALEVG